MSQGSVSAAAEISAADAVAKTLELYLECNRDIRDELRRIGSSQAAVYLASIGEQAALQLLGRLQEDIARVEGKIDELASKSERRPTGLTDRLTLTEQQQAALDAQMTEGDVNLLMKMTRLELAVSNEMDRVARRSTPLTVRLWNSIIDWWSSGK